MKTKTIIAILFIVTAVFSATAQENDKRFGVEFSGGISKATSEPGGTKLDLGLGFEGIFHYRFLAHTGVYGGWGWNRFGAEKSFAGDDVCFEETGYVLGLQYKRPFANSPVSWYLRAGGLYNHVETENADGDIINDTGHGLGWQAAAGIDLPLGKKWSLTPGVKFNALSRDSEFDGVEKQLDYNYLSLRVGILKKF